jgi:chromatin remodeling complex protein RSC6
MAGQKNNKKVNKEKTVVEEPVETVEVETVDVSETENIDTEAITNKFNIVDDNTMDILIQEFKKDLITQKEIHKRQEKKLIEMEKVNKKNKRLNKRKSKGSKGGGKNKEPSGFNKPSPIPENIIKLGLIENSEGLTCMARTEVTKKLYKYIKTKELQDPQDKRIIHPDAKLRII